MNKTYFFNKKNLNVIKENNPHIYLAFLKELDRIKLDDMINILIIYIKSKSSQIN